MRIDLQKSCSAAALTMALLSAGAAAAQSGPSPSGPAPGSQAVPKPQTGSAASGATAKPTSDTSVLEEVIVTAQRREENVQNAPVAINVISAVALADANITNSTELSRLVPSLQNARAGGPFSLFFLRGVGSYTGNSLTDAAVAVSLDDVPLARQYAVNGQFYDLQRVEVLKGPQGTLYGRNATGGVISLIPQHPTFSKDIEAGVVLGNYGTFQSTGMVNADLTPNSAVRLSFQTIKHDGYLSDGEADEDSQAVRLQYRLDPVERLSMVLSADYFRQQGRGGGNALLDGGFSASDRVGLADPRAQAYFSSIHKQVVTPSQLHLDSRTGGVHAQITYEADLGTLVLIPSYRVSEINYIADNGALLNNRENDHQASMEGRFVFKEMHGFTPTVGAYYLRDIVTADFLVDNLSIPNTAASAGNLNVYRTTTQGYAVFADTTYAVTDAVRLIAGVRYTEETKTLNGFTDVFGPTPPLFINASRTFVSEDYRLGGEWNVTSNSMLYATYSTGFHSGGFFFTHDNPSYEPERMKSFTLGSKNQFLDNRLQANLELFRWRYSNQQLTGIIVDSVGATVFATLNAGQSTIQGGEVELQYKLFPDTLVGLQGLYLDSTFDKFSLLQPFPATGSACVSTRAATAAVRFNVNCSGLTPPNSPRTTINLSGQQTFHTSDGGLIVANLRGHHQTSTYTALNFLASDIQKAYWSGDATLTYTPESKRWSASAFIDNINDVAIKTLTNHTNVASAQLRAPRTYGLRLGVHF